MTTKTWAFVDRSEWSRGPWDQEGYDKLVWKDSNTGLDCMLHRNAMGAWCGYVGVPKQHPLFGVHYNDLYEHPQDLDAHGGITFTEGCHGMDENGRGICHPADNGNHVWWIGFDCSHSGDRTPYQGAYFSGDGTYRTQAYATSEVASLASQVAKAR